MQWNLEDKKSPCRSGKDSHLFLSGSGNRLRQNIKWAIPRLAIK